MAKDLFSRQAELYKLYRPDYPLELFDYILSHVPEKNTAWDCATGNGQAAKVLSGYFKRVCATDISQKQLDQAIPDNKIDYSVSAAERTNFPDHNFDLVTVAQAYHWFKFDEFAAEVNRVLKPGAVIAIWGYGLAESASKEINELTWHLYETILGTYWDPERRYIEDHYVNTPFPYEEIPSRDFFIDKHWRKDTLLGYLHSWSSLQKFIQANGYDPLNDFSIELDKRWKDGEQLLFRFPLFLRLGRTSGRSVH